MGGRGEAGVEGHVLFHLFIDLFIVSSFVEVYEWHKIVFVLGVQHNDLISSICYEMITKFS